MIFKAKSAEEVYHSMLCVTLCSVLFLHNLSFPAWTVTEEKIKTIRDEDWISSGSVQRNDWKGLLLLCVLRFTTMATNSNLQTSAPKKVREAFGDQCVCILSTAVRTENVNETEVTTVKRREFNCLHEIVYLLKFHYHCCQGNGEPVLQTPAGSFSGAAEGPSLLKHLLFLVKVSRNIWCKATF